MMMMETRMKNRGGSAATALKPDADQPKAPASKPGTKPDAKDDFKSLPLAEVEKKLASSPDGLSQAEAE